MNTLLDGLTPNDLPPAGVGYLSPALGEDHPHQAPSRLWDRDGAALLISHISHPTRKEPHAPR